MYKKLLLGTDGSVHSRRATAAAAVMARAFAADIAVAAVAVEQGTMSMPWNLESVDRAIPPERAEKWAMDEVAWLSEQGADAEAMVLHGRAAEALAKESSRGGYDVLIVGHRGRTGGQTPRMGSVAMDLTDLISCALLIVP